MLYLKVKHVDDDDCDLFKFPLLYLAFLFLTVHKTTDFVMTDEFGKDNEFPDNDYTLIDVESKVNEM